LSFISLSITPWEVCRLCRKAKEWPQYRTRLLWHCFTPCSIWWIFDILGWGCRRLNKRHIQRNLTKWDIDMVLELFYSVPKNIFWKNHSLDFYRRLTRGNGFKKILYKMSKGIWNDFKMMKLRCSTLHHCPKIESWFFHASVPAFFHQIL
jgi:hypothetical protein